jgi:hypothetical protein
MKYTKQDNKLVVEAPERVIQGETREYSLNYLKSQERAILAQIERHTAEFMQDLLEVRKMISEAEKLGIKEEVYEDKIDKE